MPRKAITAQGASSIGPYSHAIDSEGLVFLSGQTPVNPATGKLVGGDIETETEACFRNLFAVLAAAGLGQEDVVKVNVYLADMTDFPKMNSIYEKQFSLPYPARTTIGVAALPLGAKIEIELVARRR
jgi:2-iminobutanoate/2-iminopropanoate deaminase